MLPFYSKFKCPLWPRVGRPFLPIRVHALRPGGGSIVNMSSVLGLKGTANLAAYVASKHAVVGLTRSAASDYARHGIRINAVAPGPIETRMLTDVAGGDPQSFAQFVPMGRIGQPPEIANAVLWLLSDPSSFVTGRVLTADGGWNGSGSLQELRSRSCLTSFCVYPVRLMVDRMGRARCLFSAGGTSRWRPVASTRIE